MADSPLPGWLGLSDATSDFNSLSFIVQQRLAKVRTLTLVKVVAIHGSSDQYTVDVQPIVNQVDGKGNPQAHSTVYGAPVLNSGGVNGSVLVAPTAGDYGLLAVCDRDISAAYAGKGIANPGSRRMHDLSDGVYLGGLGDLNTTAHKILIDSTGITLNSTKAVTVNAPNGLTISAAAGVTITGDVSVTGKITATGNISN